MDKKMGSLLADFSNMEEQMRVLRFELPSEGYLNSEHFLSKSRGFKSREKSKSKNNINVKKTSQLSASSRARSSTKSIHSKHDNSIKEIEP